MISLHKINYMKPGNFIPCILFVLLLISSAVYSQDSTTDKKEKSHFSAGIKYLSRNVYLGRTDSAKVSYITPTIGYYSKSGFHLSGSLSYMPNDGANRIDVGTIEAGYDFNIGSHLFAGIYADQFFYNTGSFVVNAEIHTSLGMYAGYDLGFVTLNGGAGFSFSKQSDLVTEGGISHSFFADKERLEITPDFRFNAGSQNYYNAYYSSGRAINAGKANAKAHGKSRGNSGSGSVTQSTVQVVSSSQFRMLDYELSIPVKYNLNKWTFQITPVYAIPVSPATIMNGQQLTKETLANHLYEELEVTLSF